MSSASSSTGGAAVPWADLLPELCGLVVDRLDAMSVLKFPSVCTAWSAACKESPRLRSGSPTMLTSFLGGDVDGDGYTVYDYEDGIFALHDVSTGRSFVADAEGLRDRCWVGGKDDWLVTTDGDCTVELLNPITGARSRLPSFDTIPGVKLNGEFDVCVEREPYPQSLQRVALSRKPVHREGYLAVAMFSRNLLAFTRFGDKSWTVLKNNPVAEEGIRYADTIVVHEQKVVAVSQSGGVYSWDMDGKATGPTVLREPNMSGPLDRKFKLAMSSGGGGRVLLVCMYGYTTWDGHQTRRRIYDVGQQGSFFRAFDVVLYELDETSNSTWRRVSDIGGDRALFLGANYPFYVTVPRGGGSKDLKANCIYVADMSSSDAAVIDLGMGEDNFGRLVYSGESDAFQMPMWFRPTAYLEG